MKLKCVACCIMISTLTCITVACMRIAKFRVCKVVVNSGIGSKSKENTQVDYDGSWSTVQG